MQAGSMGTILLTLIIATILPSRYLVCEKRSDCRILYKLEDRFGMGRREVWQHDAIIIVLYGMVNWRQLLEPLVRNNKTHTHTGQFFCLCVDINEIRHLLINPPHSRLMQCYSHASPSVGFHGE